MATSYKLPAPSAERRAPSAELADDHRSPIGWPDSLAFIRLSAFLSLSVRIPIHHLEE